MGLRKYTQEEFDKFDIVNGYRICPSGDYTEIKRFGEWCRFDLECRFGEVCYFGDKCYFGDGCAFGKRCRFGWGCSFGDECFFCSGCRFGWGCHFGNECRFGHECRFGRECRFGSGCIFGEQCDFDAVCSFGEWCYFGSCCRSEFGEFEKMVSFGGFGSVGRTTYAFLLKDGGIGIRCGCFAGNLEEFREIVHKTHHGTIHEKEYLAIADLIDLVREDYK